MVAQGRALPQEFGPKSTAHDRLMEWVEHGCLQHAWARPLPVYDEEIGLDRAWQSADGCLVQARLGKQGGPARPKPPGATRPTAGYPPAGGVAPSATC